MLLVARGNGEDTEIMTRETAEITCSLLEVGSVHHGSELAVWRRSTQFFSFTAAVHGIPLACFAISAFPFGTQ